MTETAEILALLREIRDLLQERADAVPDAEVYRLKPVPEKGERIA